LTVADVRQTSGVKGTTLKGVIVIKIPGPIYRGNSIVVMGRDTVIRESGSVIIIIPITAVTGAVPCESAGRSTGAAKLNGCVCISDTV